MIHDRDQTRGGRDERYIEAAHSLTGLTNRTREIVDIQVDKLSIIK